MPRHKPPADLSVILTQTKSHPRTSEAQLTRSHGRLFERIIRPCTRSLTLKRANKCISAISIQLSTFFMKSRSGPMKLFCFNDFKFLRLPMGPASYCGLTAIYYSYQFVYNRRLYTDRLRHILGSSRGKYGSRESAFIAIRNCLVACEPASRT